MTREVCSGQLKNFWMFLQFFIPLCIDAVSAQKGRIYLSAKVQESFWTALLELLLM